MQAEILSSLFLLPFCYYLQQCSSLLEVSCLHNRNSIRNSNCSHHAKDGVLMHIPYSINVLLALYNNDRPLKIVLKVFYLLQKPAVNNRINKILNTFYFPPAP